MLLCKTHSAVNQALRGTPLHHPTWPTAKQPQEPVQVLLKPAAKQETSDDDDDGNHVPSYHEAFNEALLSASKAVLAAQMGKGSLGDMLHYVRPL